MPPAAPRRGRRSAPAARRSSDRPSAGPRPRAAAGAGLRSRAAARRSSGNGVARIAREQGLAHPLPRRTSRAGRRAAARPLPPPAPPRYRLFKRLQSFLGGFDALQPHLLLEVANDGVEDRARVVRRALQHPFGARFGEVLPQGSNQARLADPGFARDVRDDPAALSRPLPRLRKAHTLVVAVHHRRQRRSPVQEVRGPAPRQGCGGRGSPGRCLSAL